MNICLVPTFLLHQFWKKTSPPVLSIFRPVLYGPKPIPEENVKASADFIRGLGREDLALQLIPYHRMGTSKYAALDIPYTLEDMKPMTAEEVEAVRALYESFGVPCTVSK